jgi:hypothetical protein
MTQELKDNVINGAPKKKKRTNIPRKKSLKDIKPVDELVADNETLLQITDFATEGLDQEEMALLLGATKHVWDLFYAKNKQDIDEAIYKGRLIDSIEQKRHLRDLAKSYFPPWKYRYENIYGMGLNSDLLSEEDIEFHVVDPKSVKEK